MGKVRIVHAFSAGGVVFRRVGAAAATPVARPADSAGAEPISATDAPTDADTSTLAADAIRTSAGAPPEQATEQFADAASRDVIEVVLVGRSRDNNWTLPKGTPGQGETQEETAIREVGEETGLTVRIVAEIGSIHYWFSRRGVRYKKEVMHYLMVATGGDLALHDHEYDEARWFPFSEATQRLTHENESGIVRRAEEVIRRLDVEESAQ